MRISSQLNDFTTMILLENILRTFSTIVGIKKMFCVNRKSRAGSESFFFDLITNKSSFATKS